jgi:predicted nucleotidyltransferase
VIQDSTRSRFGLAASVIDRINGIFARHPRVREVRLYGSRAKGGYRDGSDIDLTIMGSDVPDLELLHIASEIEELPLPYTVDLSLFRQIENPALIDHIARVGKIFYSAPAVLAR